MLPVVRSTLLLFGSIAALASSAFAMDLETRFFVDGKAGGTMEAGKPSRWQFEFTDPMSGHPPHHFHVMHAKPMHLIVISQDLSSFVHIHPDYLEHAHRPFEIRVNQTHSDPDNFDVVRAVPMAGNYFLFAEVMPMNYGMLLFPYDLLVKGPAREAIPLNIDSLQADGTIIKHFDRQNAAVPEALANYRARVRIEAFEHCGTVLPKLYLDLESREGAAETFSPVMNLDPWLESYGHAIVLGSKGTTAASKIVQHLHAVWPIPSGDPDDERGPSIELMAHSHGQSTPTDIYRAWIQFAHGGRVMTWDFTFAWDLEREQERIRQEGGGLFPKCRPASAR